MDSYGFFDRWGDLVRYTASNLGVTRGSSSRELVVHPTLWLGLTPPERWLCGQFSNTPALNICTPNPRPALTIKANAPLGDVEIKSVATLKAACEQRIVRC